MRKKILHIGFPKCASTTHQVYIFPLIAKIKNLKYLDHKKFYQLSLKNQTNFDDYDIFSHESYAKFYTSDTNALYFFENIKKSINKNFEVFLIIKSPKEMIKSVMFQESKVGKKKISINKLLKIYNLKDFDIIKNLEEIKKNYKKSNKIHVVKLEKISKTNIYKNLFNLNSEENRLIKNLFKKKKINNSINFQLLKIIGFLSQYINFLDYDRFLKKINKRLFFIFGHKYFFQRISKILNKIFHNNIELNSKFEKKINLYEKKYRNFKSYKIINN
jgi:hypothetical protein